MKFPPHDKHWLRRPVHSAAKLRGWLTDRGSLTARIEARCAAFRVSVAYQGLGRSDRDESFLRAGGRRRLALVREVYLLCRRTPVVFAHSVIDPRSLRGTWRRLARLGTRPLGAALFADPRIRRYPLRQKKLNRHHELYRRACAALKVRPPFLWARRSLFMLHKSPILVTEVFLPGILKLRS
ncbi:MAG: chorismate lyase [Betaproteobacteria bacterium]|nr:chorismate lyase [Betaproteobacteria bacterium]